MPQQQSGKSATKKKQHQDYNNVFQENLHEIATLLLTQVFNLGNLPTFALEKKKIHRTFYREPDILLAVKDAAGEHAETLHGEVHLKDEAEISYRAAEYAAMEFRQFRKPVRMFVLYVGAGTPVNILSKLDGGCLKIDIEIVAIHRIPVQTFLRSGKPEEIMLGILGDFGGQAPPDIIQEIIRQIQQLVPAGERLQKYWKQLEILSNLRKLQPEIVKQLNIMPLTYDLTTDIRYQQGIEQGISLAKLEMIVRLIQHSNHDDAFIADIANVETQKVAGIRRIIAQYPDSFWKHLKQA
jgi:hypothetical protein